MKVVCCCSLLLLAVCGVGAEDVDKAAGSSDGDSTAALSESEYPDKISQLLKDALLARPKKQRQIFETGTFIGSSKGDKPKTKKAGQHKAKKEDGDAEKPNDAEDKVELRQEVGWRPMQIFIAPPVGARARSLTATDNADQAGSARADSASSVTAAGDAAEDRDTDTSYLSPYYAPAPGGYGPYHGAGYSGYPYIYILPIILPPPPPAGHQHHSTTHHVVTESGESHHYRSLPPVPLPLLHHLGQHAQYGPPKEAPPVYYPRSYDAPVYDTHAAEHRDSKVDGPIIRDIEPPVFKA